MNDTTTHVRWAVVGGGNGGHACAAHLGLTGFAVNFYDIDPETVAVADKQRGIVVHAGLSGDFGPIAVATGDIKEAITGVDVIMVVTPSNAHRALAAQMAPHLVDGQIVILHPGSTGGALEFKKSLDDHGCLKEVVVCEAMSLLYACRSTQKGAVTVFGTKNKLMIAALPAAATVEALQKIGSAFPEMYAGPNVLRTSLLYYMDGITPTIGAYIEALDKERLAIGEAYGLELTPIRGWYRELYSVDGETLSDAIRKNRAYSRIPGQKSLRTRYLFEDIPMGLVPLLELGKRAGVDVSHIETIVALGEQLVGENFVADGRNLERLGLADLSVEQIKEYVETGVRAATGTIA